MERHEGEDLTGVFLSVAREKGGRDGGRKEDSRESRNA